MGFVNSWTFTQIASVSSTTITLPAAIPAGTFLVLAIGNNGSALSTNTATDSRGNTWVQGGGVLQGSTGSSRIMRCRVTTALQVGDTITITSSAAKSRWAMVLAAFDNVPANTLDASATNIATSAAPSVGPSGATTTASELVVATFMFTSGGGTFTPGSGVTEAGEVVTAAGSTDRGCALVYKYVTATGAQTLAGILTSSVAWSGVLESFVASGAPPPPPGPTAKVWNGSAEVTGTITQWNGSAEVPVSAIAVA